jgi:hypothetical protein
VEFVITVAPQEVRGELRIYSCAKHLCQPIEWALSEIFKEKIQLDWDLQAIAPGAYSTNIIWQGPASLGSRIVSVFSKWPKIRLEVFQNIVGASSSERYSLSPNLGIFRAEVNSVGETVIAESRLKSALERSKVEDEPFEVELAFLLGTPWDEDLEPFRRSHKNPIVKWISKTG